MNAALLSSKNMCWCTPQDFFDKLNAEFGFVLDPAATDKTAKCSLYYTPETDGLSQSWDRGGAVFCNPPYGREIGKWVQKAFEEARGGEYVKEHGLTLCADGFRRLIIRKEKDMATPYKECPHCGAHLDSGEKCECRAEEIEAKNSQKYACGLTEQDVESGWECPLDNPNETVERCEDCAFAKETD